MYPNDAKQDDKKIFVHDSQQHLNLFHPTHPQPGSHLPPLSARFVWCHKVTPSKKIRMTVAMIFCAFKSHSSFELFSYPPSLVLIGFLTCCWSIIAFRPIKLFHVLWNDRGLIACIRLSLHKTFELFRLILPWVF